MDEFDDKLKEKMLDYLKEPENFDERINTLINNLQFYKRKNKKFSLKRIRNFLIRIIIFILSSISVVSFATYIGEKIYKFNQSKISTKDNMEINYSDIKMIYDNENNLEYKIIDNNNDYLELKKVYNDIPNVNFDNEYLLIINIYARIIDETNILEVDVDDTTTYITLGNMLLEENIETINLNDSSMCCILDNSYKRDNVKFKIIPGSENIEKYGFLSMNNIGKDYINQRAYEENCIILDKYGNILSDNEEIIYDFVRKSENSEECALRIVKEVDEMEFLFKVVDIIYENDKYYYFHIMCNTEDKKYAISISNGKNIEFEKIGDTNQYYFSINNYDNQKIRISILTLKDYEI